MFARSSGSAADMLLIGYQWTPLGICSFLRIDLVSEAHSVVSSEVHITPPSNLLWSQPCREDQRTQIR